MTRKIKNANKVETSSRAVFFRVCVCVCACTNQENTGMDALGMVVRSIVIKVHHPVMLRMNGFEMVGGCGVKAKMWFVSSASVTGS